MTGPWWILPLISGAVVATTIRLKLRHKNFTEFPAPTNAGGDVSATIADASVAVAETSSAVAEVISKFV